MRRRTEPQKGGSAHSGNAPFCNRVSIVNACEGAPAVFLRLGGRPAHALTHYSRLPAVSLFRGCRRAAMAAAHARGKVVRARIRLDFRVEPQCRVGLGDIDPPMFEVINQVTECCAPTLELTHIPIRRFATPDQALQVLEMVETLQHRLRHGIGLFHIGGSSKEAADGVGKVIDHDRLLPFLRAQFASEIETVGQLGVSFVTFRRDIPVPEQVPGKT